MFGTKKKIHALEVQVAKLEVINRQAIEAARQSTNTIRKNNYTTYESQVDASYKMYNSKSDYGSELFQALLKTHVAFLGGGNVSYIAESKKTKDFLKILFDSNDLDSTRFYDMLITGGLEGKDLILIQIGKKNDNKYIKIRQYNWYSNRYTVNVNPADTDEIKSITYESKTENGKTKNINIDSSVYVKLGGTTNCTNDTTNRLHTILTQIENYSRALYDLRENNHLFAKIWLWIKTDTQEAANVINEDLTNRNIVIGTGYAGMASAQFLAPPLGASENIEVELRNLIKVISTTTGIPIHWLSWSDLLSNRATALTMIEMINAATKQDRKIWEKSLTEMVRKAMVLGVDHGVSYAVNDPDGFEIRIPLVTLADIENIIKIWAPLQQQNVISMSTLRNKLPEIDPIIEEKLVEMEKNEGTKSDKGNDTK